MRSGDLREQRAANQVELVGLVSGLAAPTKRMIGAEVSISRCRAAFSLQTADNLPVFSLSKSARSLRRNTALTDQAQHRLGQRLIVGRF